MNRFAKSRGKNAQSKIKNKRVVAQDNKKKYCIYLTQQ